LENPWKIHVERFVKKSQLNTERMISLKNFVYRSEKIILLN